VTNDKGDSSAYEAYGLALADAVDSAFVHWLESVVATRFDDCIPASSSSAIDEAIEQARLNTNRLLTELAVADVTSPLSGPLERIRRAVQPLAEVLDAAGATRPRRDPVDVEMRPADVYAIGPHAFAELGEDVHVAGISWGAAKAHQHMQRQRDVTEPEVADNASDRVE